MRGNSASNIQITGNSVSNVREVALYSEFSFEGAVIANNTVDGAALGVSVCNFNEGGRIAVVQGNIIRNLKPKRPIGTAPDDDAGIGIYVEADSSVTGNVIENAPSFGIVAGWGKYLRDVAITGNVIRNAFVGIGVSVTPGAEPATILDVEGGLPFGMPFDATVRVAPLPLRGGDRLVVFSDGVVEARPDDGEAYGMELLLRALDDVRDASPREATRRITRGVREHRDGDLSDDATILMIDIRPER